MTKEEAKHLSEVLKAYSEGKTIQFAKWFNGNKNWYDITEITTNHWKDKELRIKPEPKYRPYKDAEEFLKAQKEHGPYIQRINYSGFRIPEFVGNKDIKFSDDFSGYNYKQLSELCNWQDGTPCGVLE